MARIQADSYLSALKAALGGGRNEQELLDRVAAVAVPDVSDWSAVHLPEGDAVRLRALTHVDPVRANLGWQLDRRWPPRLDAAAGAGRVLRSGRTEGGTIPDELLATVAIDGEHLQVLRALGLHSYICAPIRSGAEVLGALTFVTAESGRVYEARDFSWAEEAGRMVGSAVREVWKESAALLSGLVAGGRNAPS